MNFYSKTEIAKQLGISRTVVTQYLKDYTGNGEDVLEFIKKKYIENTAKKGAGTHSVINDLKSKIKELENQLIEKNRLIFELQSKIDELSKTDINIEQNDLTRASTIEDRSVGNSNILPKIIIKKNTNKPNIELIRIVKNALDNNNHNWKQIADELGVNRDTVEKYSIRIKKGLYDKYLSS